MRILLSKYKHLLLLVFVFIISELLVNPIGNFPLNDDWTYAKTVSDYLRHSRYNIGTSSSTLWTHFIWGFCFTKVFGFSFLILRISTFISSLIGIYVFFKLIFKITENERLALFASAVLIFNPIYFNLTNTYMTDVNFNTLVICCASVAYAFFKTQNRFYFVLFFLLSMALVMLRQFGIIAPISFTLSCFFLTNKRWVYAISGLLLTLVIFLVFKYYENFLYVNHYTDPGYPFSGKVAGSLKTLWDKISLAFKTRSLLILLYVFFFSSPLLAAFFLPAIKQVNKLIVGTVVIISVLISFLIFGKVGFPMGNIFTNMQLGAETFFENLNPFVRDVNGHTYNATFAEVLFYLKVIGTGIFIIVCFLMIIIRVKLWKNAVPGPAVVCFFSVFVAYVVLLLVSDMYFDRYHLPLITLTLIALSTFNRQLKAEPKLVWLIILPMFYASVFGTKDYFTLNRTKWEAYHFLRNNLKIPPEKINAGYEVNLWNDGKYIVPYEPVFLESHSYLIQYRKEPGFKPLMEYEFQRYFPFKKDKIYIFVREDKK